MTFAISHIKVDHGVGFTNQMQVRDAAGVCVYCVQVYAGFKWFARRRCERFVANCA